MFGKRQFSRLLRSSLEAVFLVVLLVLIALTLTLTHARALEFAVRQVLTSSASPMQEFSIGSLSYSFPSSWRLGALRATMCVEGEPPVRLFVNRIEIKDALHLVTEGRPVQVAVSGIEAAQRTLQVRGAHCTVEVSRASDGVVYSGSIGVSEVAQDSIRVSDVRAEFFGDERSVVLRDLSARVCGGQVSGSAGIRFDDPPAYAADLTVRDVDVGELERAMGGLFRELGGQLSGEVHVAGAGERIELFDTSWNMPEGGAISASLLSSVARYIPDSAQRRRLDGLIRSGGKLAVEFFLFTLKNDSPDHLSGQIGIKSREANLELNVTHEVQVDARIDSMLLAWRAVFQ